MDLFVLIRERERLPCESESGSPRCLVREKKETKVSFLSSRCSLALALLFLKRNHSSFIAVTREGNGVSNF